MSQGISMEELEHAPSVSLILTGFYQSLLQATTIESTIASIWRQPLLPADAAIARSAAANPLVYGWDASNHGSTSARHGEKRAVSINQLSGLGREQSRGVSRPPGAEISGRDDSGIF